RAGFERVDDAVDAERADDVTRRRAGNCPLFVARYAGARVDGRAVLRERWAGGHGGGDEERQRGGSNHESSVEGSDYTVANCGQIRDRRAMTTSRKRLRGAFNCRCISGPKVGRHSRRPRILALKRLELRPAPIASQGAARLHKKE